MGIVADSRFSDIDRWLSRQLDELTGLAKNESLQIYTDQINGTVGGRHAERPGRGVARLPAQPADGHGRPHRLLTIPGSDSSEVPANVSETGVAGLMIIDSQGNVVAASPGAPPFTGELQAFVSSQTQGQRVIGDMRLNSRGVPSMAFVVPILAAQTEGAQATQIGIILGVKEVGQEIFPLLKQPGEPARPPNRLWCAPRTTRSPICRLTKTAS
jgi:hypothetical protein